MTTAVAISKTDCRHGMCCMQGAERHWLCKLAALAAPWRHRRITLMPASSAREEEVPLRRGRRRRAVAAP